MSYGAKKLLIYIPNYYRTLKYIHWHFNFHQIISNNFNVINKANTSHKTQQLMYGVRTQLQNRKKKEKKRREFKSTPANF